MTRVPAFHSIEENHYHHNDKCERGNKIPALDRVRGNGGKPLCRECKKLDGAGK